MFFSIQLLAYRALCQRPEARVVKTVSMEAWRQYFLSLYYLVITTKAPCWDTHGRRGVRCCGSVLHPDRWRARSSDQGFTSGITLRPWPAPHEHHKARVTIFVWILVKSWASLSPSGKFLSSTLTLVVPRPAFVCIRERRPSGHTQPQVQGEVKEIEIITKGSQPDSGLEAKQGLHVSSHGPWPGHHRTAMLDPCPLFPCYFFSQGRSQLGRKAIWKVASNFILYYCKEHLFLEDKVL